MSTATAFPTDSLTPSQLFRELEKEHSQATHRAIREALYSRTLDLGEFHAWLKTFPPNHRIGTRADCRHCPIREFLVWKIQPGWTSDWVQVDGDSWTCFQWFDSTFLPEWAREFVAAVDDGVENTWVTAGLCLRLLEGVTS